MDAEHRALLEQSGRMLVFSDSAPLHPAICCSDSAGLQYLPADETEQA